MRCREGGAATPRPPKLQPLRFDLHVHTRRLSEDATLDPLAAAERLRALGYAGFAITEHDAVWPLGWLEELRRATPLLVIRGLEIQTEEVGHVLVYGWDDEPIWRYHRLGRLMAAVRAKGAVAAVAHPFRRRSAPWGTPADPATAEALLPWWRLADGVEARNGRVSAAENRLAAELAGRLGGLAVAGSDAHRPEDLGRAATLLPAGIGSEEEAVAALRNRSVRVETGEGGEVGG